MTTIKQIVNEAQRTVNLTYEQKIRVCIQPKPRWLPSFVWRWLLKRLIVVEMTQPSFRAV